MSPTHSAINKLGNGRKTRAAAPAGTRRPRPSKTGAGREPVPPTPLRPEPPAAGPAPTTGVTDGEAKRVEKGPRRGLGSLGKQSLGRSPEVLVLSLERVLTQAHTSRRVPASTSHRPTDLGQAAGLPQALVADLVSELVAIRQLLQEDARSEAE